MNHWRYKYFNWDFTKDGMFKFPRIKGKIKRWLRKKTIKKNQESRDSEDEKELYESSNRG